MLTLVVPNAESGFVPKVKFVRVTLAAPTEKPIDPVTAGTWAVAVRVAAPAAFRLAGFSVTVAVPVASVSAVPEGGTNTPNVESVVNVTTTLGIPTPTASITIALPVGGIGVFAGPVVGLESVGTRLGARRMGGGGGGGGGT